MQRVFDADAVEDVSEDQDSEELERVLLPSERLKQAKAKGKGKGKDKNGKGDKKKSKKKDASRQSSTRRWVQLSNKKGPSISAASAGPASVASVKHSQLEGGSTASDGGRTKVSKGSVERHVWHIEAINLSRILAGKSLGDKLYHARRAAKDLEKSKTHAAEAVLLRGHIAMAEQCQALVLVPVSLEREREVRNKVPANA